MGEQPRPPTTLDEVYDRVARIFRRIDDRRTAKRKAKTS